MAPFAPHPFSMTWRDGLFVHWPFDPAAVRPHVPEPLELDTHDGRAWVSVLPFVLADAGLRGSPSRTRLTFPELNVRTYVRFDGEPGLYFFSVDVDSRLVPFIVGRTTRLPCYRADIDLEVRGDSVYFRSDREHGGRPRGRFEATYRPEGRPFHPERGSLDFWLAERRRMYDPVGDRTLYAEISHDPWLLHGVDLTVHENTLFADTTLPEPLDDPRVRYCYERSMTGSVPRWIDGLEGDSRVRPERLANR